MILKSEIFKRNMMLLFAFFKLFFFCFLLLLAIFNFHFRFWSRSHIDILLAAGAYIAQKWCVPSSLLKEKWTVKIGNSKKSRLKNLHSFSLQPAQDPFAQYARRLLL